MAFLNGLQLNNLGPFLSGGSFPEPWVEPALCGSSCSWPLPTEGAWGFPFLGI